MMTEKKYAVGWLIFFLLLNVVYIIIEFSFNARLVDVAGAVYTDALALQQLEVIARLLSGTGLGLSLIGWFALHKRKLHVAIVVLVVTFGISIPLMYQLQSRLVNYLVNDHFTPHDRKTAQYALVLKSGIEHDNLRLKDVAFDPAFKDEPEQNTFLALIGVVMFHSDGLMQQMQSNQAEIAQVFIHNYIVDHEAEYWNKYQDAYANLRQQWTTYQDATRQYIEQVNHEDARINDIWKQVEDSLEQGWQTYRQAVHDLEVNVREQVPVATRQLDQYFKTRQQCFLEECYQLLDAEYRKHIVALTGRYIEPEFWLVEKDESWQRRHCRSVNQDMVCDESSVEVQTQTEGDANEMQQVWDAHAAVVLSKLMLLQQDEFKRQAGGYGINVSSREAFIVHPQTVSRVRQSLLEQGIELPQNWHIGKNNAFSQAAEKKVRALIDAQWRERVIAQLGEYLPPNLSFTEFVRSDFMRERMKTLLAENYVEDARPDYTREEFYQHLLLPLVERYALRMNDRLNADEREFADAGIYAEQSKQYLKLLVIPPVAMFFSLLFGLIALVKLPALLLAIYDAWRGNSTTAMLIRFKMVLIWLATILILILPMQVVTNKFSASDSGFQKLLDDVDMHKPLVGYAVQWMIRIQPLLYPFGHQVGLFNHESTKN